MYTKEKLESKDFIKIYEFVGKTAYKSILKVEEILLKRKSKRDLDVQLDKESFVTRDNTMHYTNSIHLNSYGSYLKANFTKTIGVKLLDISLELGKEGFDYTTGERFERKQAKVLYTLDNNKINIKEIKDEIYYNELEEQYQKDLQERVLKLKKD